MVSLGRARSSGAPSPATTRKIHMLVELVRRRHISLRALQQAFAISERTLLRDLQELRQIGKALGFRISERNGADTVELTDF